MSGRQVVMVTMEQKRKKKSNKSNTKKVRHVEEDWRLMYFQLEPDTWSVEQRDEMLSMLNFFIHEKCDKEKDATTIKHLLTMIRYYGATIEQRARVDEVIAQQALHGKLDDAIVFIFNPAKEVEKYAKGYGEGTAPFKEVVGFISYQHDKKAGTLYIGHFFVTESKRRKRVGHTAMNELVKKVCFEDKPEKIPLLVTDVDIEEKGVLQFLFMCGFVFTRQPGTQGMGVMNFEEAVEAGIEMSLQLPKQFATSEEMAQHEKYKLFLNEDTQTWRLTLSLADHCYGCKKEVPHANLQRCGRCKAAYYCGPTCQENDHSVHKLVCKVDRF